MITKITPLQILQIFIEEMLSHPYCITGFVYSIPICWPITNTDFVTLLFLVMAIIVSWPDWNTGNTFARFCGACFHLHSQTYCFWRRDVEAQPAGLVWESDWLCSGHSPEDRPASSEKTDRGSAFTAERLQCGECSYNKLIHVTHILISRVYVKLPRFTVNSVKLVIRSVAGGLSFFSRASLFRRPKILSNFMISKINMSALSNPYPKTKGCATDGCICICSLQVKHSLSFVYCPQTGQPNLGKPCCVCLLDYGPGRPPRQHEGKERVFMICVFLLMKRHFKNEIL